MKTTTIEVGELVSSLSAMSVERQLAALSMSGSSALVAINALMLKRTKLAGIKSVKPKATATAAPAAAGETT